MTFINDKMNELYLIRTGQHDCNVIVPKLDWVSKLSRITPRVAEHMLAHGTNLITRKTIQDVNLRQSQSADKTVGNQSKRGAGKRNIIKGHKPQEQ